MTRTLSMLFLCVAVAAIPACDLDVPDLNNPPIDELEDNPTRENVVAATQGLMVGHRGNVAAANGYVAQLGILGREAYNFDGADPRFVGELLAGPLQKGSPFGGNFWVGPYANLRMATLVISGADKVINFSTEERAGIRGFAETIMALDLLRVITTRDTIGAVIEVGLPAGQLGQIVPKEMVYAEIARLLDHGAMELGAGGMTFAFRVPPAGFLGFTTPAGFLKLNRAMRARVAAYMGDYPTVLTALAASFLNEAVTDLAGLNAGAYYTFSTAPGDALNGLVNRNIFAHPSIVTDAQPNDARVTRKIRTVSPPGSAQMLMSDRKFTMYTATAPVPIIRNEELLLLRAEARLKMSQLAEAVADINRVRSIAGGLGAFTSNDPVAIETELLYNRRYSLLFEGGHRWIDLRRFNRIAELPLDRPDHVRNVRYPIPQAECDGRPDEPACAIMSM